MRVVKILLLGKNILSLVYPVGDSEINDSEICIGENVLFTDISEGIGLDYKSQILGMVQLLNL